MKLRNLEKSLKRKNKTYLRELFSLKLEKSSDKTVFCLGY